MANTLRNYTIIAVLPASLQFGLIILIFGIGILIAFGLWGLWLSYLERRRR